MANQQIELKDFFDKHMNGAAEIVQIACSFDSQVYISTNNKRINAKSIMGIMAFCSDVGEQITVSAEGSDENAALEAVVGLLTK